MPLFLPVLVAAAVGPASPSLRVVSATPRFLAPGGSLVVPEWMDRGLQVRLLVDGRATATPTSGRLGGFVVKARAPGVGHHRLVVVAGTDRGMPGRPRVRPLLLAAAGDVPFGTDVASLGPAALLDTLALSARAWIATVGGGRSLAATRRHVVVTRGGLRIAFLGYSDINPDGFVAGPSTPGAAPASSIAADVRAARCRADLVVVWFHWGRSLGNFVFPPHSPGTSDTGVLLIRLDARGVRGYSFRAAEIAGVQPRLRSSR